MDLPALLRDGFERHRQGDLDGALECYRRVLAHSDRAVVLQKGIVELAGAAADVARDPALTKLLGV